MSDRYRFSRLPSRARRRALWLAVLCACCAHAAFAQTYRYVGSIGTAGPGTLDFPNDVQVDPVSHVIAVSDAGNNRVVRFNSAGAFLGAFGTSGTGNGEFDYPAGIGIDPVSHDIYVGDYYNHRVERFDSGGAYLGQFATGSGFTPCGILVLPSRQVLVSGGYGASVQIYDAAGQPAGSFGSAANFGYACNMALAGANVYVADETNTNVQVFSTAGSYVGQFGSSGSGNGQFASPSPGGLALDPLSHHLVVADYGNNRIEIFDQQGQYLAQFGSFGSAAGQFDGPTGVAIDPATGLLLVADRGNNRIQEFTQCGATPVTLSILPQTQQAGQAVFFSASIGNVLRPGGSVSIFADDGSLVCTAAVFGDPQASCTGLVALGIHAVTAAWSGGGANPSGCSAPATVAVVSNLTPTGTSLNLVGPPNGINQGWVFTLNASVAPSGPQADAAGLQNAPAPSGFVTFYDGSNVLAATPLSGNTATYTNRIAGGAHAFAAVYSGDGTYASGSASAAVNSSVPADDIFYDGLEVRRGN